MLKLTANKKNSDFVFTNQPKEVRDIVFRDGNNRATILTAPIINTQHFSESRFKSLQLRIEIDSDRLLGHMAFDIPLPVTM